MNMLSLAEIDGLKEDGDKLLHFVRTETNGSLTKILEKLGRLPENFDKRGLLHLVNNESSKASYGDFEREIDFFLKENGKIHKCEVKLMGKGNPESADAFIARESNIFVADKPLE